MSASWAVTGNGAARQGQGPLARRGARGPGHRAVLLRSSGAGAVASSGTVIGDDRLDGPPVLAASAQEFL